MQVFVAWSEKNLMKDKVETGCVLFGMVKKSLNFRKLLVSRPITQFHGMAINSSIMR